MIGSQRDRLSTKKATWVWPKKKAQMHSGRVGKRCSSVDKGVKTRRGEEDNKLAVGVRYQENISTRLNLKLTHGLSGGHFSKEVEGDFMHGYGPVECDPTSRRARVGWRT